MLTTSDFREGLIYLDENGQCVQILTHQHHRKSQARAVISVKLRNLDTGAITETSYRPEDKFREVDVEKRPKTYMYAENGMYHFMDNEDFVQPVRYPVFETSLGTIAMIICFDFSFEEPTRQMVNGGAQLMGASVGDWSILAPSRIATVQLRAAENRVSFVKSESINGSAIVDATGTIVSSADMGPDGGEALLVADVPLGPRGAPYTSLGPLFGYLCVLLLVGRIALQVRLEVVARRRVLAAGRLHATAGTAT